MASLERTETCGFPIGDSHTIAELEEMSESERAALLIPTEMLFQDLASIRLPSFYEKLCRDGCEIYLKKIGVSFPIGSRVRLCSADGSFFAIGEIGEFKNGIAVKAIKTFVL